jgi:hypothetical protein
MTVAVRDLILTTLYNRASVVPDAIYERYRARAKEIADEIASKVSQRTNGIGLVDAIKIEIDRAEFSLYEDVL